MAAQEITSYSIFPTLVEICKVVNVSISMESSIHISRIDLSVTMHLAFGDELLMHFKARHLDNYWNSACWRPLQRRDAMCSCGRGTRTHHIKQYRLIP